MSEELEKQNELKELKQTLLVIR